MLLCTDCRHYRGGLRICHARSQVITETSPFDGKTASHTRGWKFIDEARGPKGECGPDAKLFEPDDTMLYKVGVFLASVLTLAVIGLMFFGILGGAIWFVVQIVKFGMSK